LKDLEPVIYIGSEPLLIVGRKSLAADDLKGLIAWLKANPDKATQGTAGPGSGQHVSGVYFQKVTGTSFNFVPYRAGSVDIIRDMAGGHIDITFDQAITALSHIKNGTVKAYAVTQKGRLAAAPDIPSVDEVGAPGVYISTWFGLWLPAGAPKDVAEKLAAAARTALADPVVAKKLEDFGQQIFPAEQQTPAGLAAYHKAEIERWWPVIKAAGIRLDESK
jgi:tripartite-type tricarboxylate transporter receptor subunit TctC